MLNIPKIYKNILKLLLKNKQKIKIKFEIELQDKDCLDYLIIKEILTYINVPETSINKQIFIKGVFYFIKEFADSFMLHTMAEKAKELENKDLKNKDSQKDDLDKNKLN